MNLNKISNIIAWIFIILGVIFILWKIIGGSPSEFSILITLNIGILFKMVSVGNSVSKLEANHKNLRNQFKTLAVDFKEHLKRYN